MKARLLAIAILVAATSAYAGAAGPKASPKKAPAAPPAATNSCTACVERGPILPAKLFADPRFDKEVVPAYEAALKYPATLDRLHCFCECQESMAHRHKTLLTCFTDLHAAGCGICLSEARLAYDLKSRGLSDDEVVNTVESVHKTDGHPATHGGN